MRFTGLSRVREVDWHISCALGKNPPLAPPSRLEDRLQGGEFESLFTSVIPKDSRKEGELESLPPPSRLEAWQDREIESLLPTFRIKDMRYGRNLKGLAPPSHLGVR